MFSKFVVVSPRRTLSLFFVAALLILLASITRQRLFPTPPTTPTPPPTPVLPPTQTAAPLQLATSPFQAVTLGRKMDITVVMTPTAPPPSLIFVQAVDQDVDSFNPVLSANPVSQRIAQQLFPQLVKQNIESGLAAPLALAEDWEITQDGRVYTFHLRKIFNWSDGQPVTAHDVAFTYAALASETGQSPYRATVENIESVVDLDDYTLQVRLRNADCATILALGRPLLPSHRYAKDFSDLATNPLNSAPYISAGPFRFGAWAPNERITLLRDPTYRHAPAPIQQWDYRIITAAAERWQRLITGEVDLIQLTPEQRPQGEPQTGVSFYSYPSDSLNFIALNLADPTNPQPGQDTAGNLLAQTPHPILSEVAVRRALAMDLEFAALTAGPDKDSLVSLSSYLLPTLEWVYIGDQQPYPYDPAAAGALLDGAGWRDSNDDGIRDRAGAPLRLSLLTNADSPQRVQMGEQAAQQLRTLGVDIQFEAVAFETLIEQALGQRFDLALLGWENLGPDPATSPFWHSREDQPGVGYNITSYQNPDVDKWLDDARTAPYCDTTVRRELYRQVQRQVQVDAPYILLHGRMVTWAYRAIKQPLRLGPWGMEIGP